MGWLGRRTSPLPTDVGWLFTGHLNGGGHINVIDRWASCWGQLDGLCGQSHVIEYFSDKWRVVDTRDDSALTATFGATQHIHTEDSGHELRPQKIAPHRVGLFGFSNEGFTGTR